MQILLRLDKHNRMWHLRFFEICRAPMMEQGWSPQLDIFLQVASSLAYKIIHPWLRVDEELTSSALPSSDFHVLVVACWFVFACHHDGRLLSRSSFRAPWQWFRVQTRCIPPFDSARGAGPQSIRSRRLLSTREPQPHRRFADDREARIVHRVEGSAVERAFVERLRPLVRQVWSGRQASFGVRAS